MASDSLRSSLFALLTAALGVTACSSTPAPQSPSDATPGVTEVKAAGQADGAHASCGAKHDGSCGAKAGGESSCGAKAAPAAAAAPAADAKPAADATAVAPAAAPSAEAAKEVTPAKKTAKKKKAGAHESSCGAGSCNAK